MPDIDKLTRSKTSWYSAVDTSREQYFRQAYIDLLMEHDAALIADSRKLAAVQEFIRRNSDADGWLLAIGLMKILEATP
jgi:hypothetical protein